MTEPTPRLSAVLDEIQAKMAEVYTATEGRPELSFGRGVRALNYQGAPPRVTLVPTTGQFASSDHTTNTSGRKLVTRRVSIVAHLWGPSFDETEQLIHDFIVALHRTTWGSMSLSGEQWPDDETTNAGTLALVTFSIDIPVARPAHRRARLTKIEWNAEGAVSGDGIIEADEP